MACAGAYVDLIRRPLVALARLSLPPNYGPRTASCPEPISRAREISARARHLPER